MFRAAAVTVIAAVTGFGFLLFLDASRMWRPNTGPKEMFFLLGFVVAVATGLVLLKLWPSQGRSHDQDRSSSA
jgi:hypothetical protein